MSLKEHLQFLAMLIPTLLLLAAATVSLTFPAGRVAAAEAGAIDLLGPEPVVMAPTEPGSIATVEAK
jgi:hypothetical protein